MKKLEKMKYVALGMIIASLTCTSAQVAFAELVTKNITVFKGVNLYIDDVKFTPKDSKENVIEPFIYNGTTYLPVRAVGEAVNKAITWEESTNSVYIGKHSSNKPTEMLHNLTPMNDDGITSGEFSSKDNEGTSYNGTIYGLSKFTTATYNIDSKYDTLKGRIILFYKYKNYGAKGHFIVYGDGKQLYSSPTVTTGVKPINFNVDVAGVKQLKIAFESDSYFGSFWGIVNAGLYQ